MMGLRFHFRFLVLCACLILPITQCLAHTCLPEEHAALFIFGDSLFDAGNNNYINATTNFPANVWPYGETFFKYPTGRASNGRLIPDFIAEYAKLPFILPYLHPGYPRYTDGANFASGGAGALFENSSRRGWVIDLNTQLKYFKNMETVLKRTLGEAQTKKLLSRAVYLFSIGTNDYAAPFSTNSSLLRFSTHEEYVDMVIGNFTTVIKEIHRKGGRKFGFLNLPPAGYFPSTKATMPQNSEEITALVKRHNKALSHALQILASQLEGFKYSYTNLYNFITERMNNPLKYGFKEGRMGCCGSGPYRGIQSCGRKRSINDQYELCGNPSEYLFFDSAHPSEKANEQLAKLLWNGNLDVTWPYNLKALFGQKQREIN
ncbi:GDSL esterase/lipase 1-like isoform X1 [Corylus avellana]|uniref:GDSL esterase/lipase 1-like isoform X1 n=1 Tax=Corylus avellana TaxID=13451 RepID=UPI001E23565B|nr:GDSL esterase/lipase 1-like isoform X1 [Corylus avellana]